MNFAGKVVVPTIFLNLYLSRHNLWFQKTLAQERFKSDINWIVSAIKFRKCLAKLMILIALFQKCLGMQIIAGQGVHDDHC